MARSNGGKSCFPDREEEGENFKMKVNEVDFLSKFDGKGKAIPFPAWTGPEGSRRLRLPDANRHMEVLRLSALRTGRLYLQEIFLVHISMRG
jgi:hypothetical protein